MEGYEEVETSLASGPETLDRQDEIPEEISPLLFLRRLGRGERDGGLQNTVAKQGARPLYRRRHHHQGQPSRPMR